MFNLDKHAGYCSLKSANNILHTFIESLIDESVKTDVPLNFEEFINNIEPFAQAMVDKGYTHNMNNVIPAEIVAKIKGDIFEIFVMFTLQYFEKNSNFGIKEGTYQQFSDYEDIGMDFKGIDFANNRRVFGQIKFCDPNRKITSDNFPFTRKVYTSLIGTAVEFENFTKDTDILFLVTNRAADDVLHHKLQSILGWTGASVGRDHFFVKIIDKSVFEKIIGKVNRTFWNAFLEAC